MRIELTGPQAEFFKSEAKYPALVAGFGAGKSEALIARRVAQAIRNPKNDFAFYQPTYDLIRQIAMPRFESFLEQTNIPYRLIKSPSNELHMEGLGKIIFRSMDTPERIIGYEVADSDVDELDTLKRDDAAYVWRQIIARNRQKKLNEPNTAAVATTPEGFRFVYETWALNKPPGYEIIRAPTYSNPHLPEDYVQSLKDIYPEHLLAAYIEGEFVNLTAGAVYIQFKRAKCSSHETIQGHEPLYVGMDFNVGNMAAVIHVKRNGVEHAVDEVSKGYDTPDMCRILKDRYPNNSIIVYPDASGSSRKSINAATSDIQILQEHGFSVYALDKNPAVKDRINSMNGAFEKGIYKVNIDRCPTYTRGLEQQAYNDKGEPDKTQGLDHHPDAGGYYIHYEHPLIKPAMEVDLRMMI